MLDTLISDVYQSSLCPLLSSIDLARLSQVCTHSRSCVQSYVHSLCLNQEKFFEFSPLFAPIRNSFLAVQDLLLYKVEVGSFSWISSFYQLHRLNLHRVSGNQLVWEGLPKHLPNSVVEFYFRSCFLTNAGYCDPIYIFSRIVKRFSATIQVLVLKDFLNYNRTSGLEPIACPQLWKFFYYAIYCDWNKLLSFIEINSTTIKSIAVDVSSLCQKQGVECFKLLNLIESTCLELALVYDDTIGSLQRLHQLTRLTLVLPDMHLIRLLCSAGSPLISPLQQLREVALIIGPCPPYDVFQFLVNFVLPSSASTIRVYVSHTVRPTLTDQQVHYFSEILQTTSTKKTISLSLNLLHCFNLSPTGSPVVGTFRAPYLDLTATTQMFCLNAWHKSVFYHDQHVLWFFSEKISLYL